MSRRTGPAGEDGPKADAKLEPRPMSRPGTEPAQQCEVRSLRVALDTTFAGINATGVGLYSRNLTRELGRLAGREHLELSRFGPSASERPTSTLAGTIQEWPTYTQGVLPAKMWLRRDRPDVVHSTSHIGPLGAPGKLVVTVHDLIFRRYPDDYNPVWLAITRALLPAVLKRAAAVAADSETTRHDLVHFYGVDPSRIEVVYPGVDGQFRDQPGEDELEAYMARLGIGAGPYILCLGPWVRRKNVGTVVRAFGLLNERLPGCQLVLTGSATRGMKGDSPDRLLAQLAEDARSRVHLVGYVPASGVRLLMAGATLLAYPSRFEGFGLPPLEAMASRVPVVASDTPVVREVTRGHALLAPVDSPSLWAEAFYSILSNPEKATQLQDAGRVHALHFTWERCCLQMIDIYRRVARVA